MTQATQDSAAKKDTQRLQRAIIDGLEDVKAQDIAVFNTEHLSPLFERVIVASGTSNRQTKALAASVRDAVREAGFPKPRIEGEENGEWIIVDCGAAVAHIMQPAIRTYYHLEEIWGEKPVRLKFGAPRPMAQAEEPAPAKKTGKTLAKTAGKSGAKGAGKATAKTSKAASAPPVKSAGRNAAKTASRAPAKKAPARTAPTRTAPAKTATKATAKSSGAAKKPAGKRPQRGK